MFQGTFGSLSGYDSSHQPSKSRLVPLIPVHGQVGSKDLSRPLMPFVTLQLLPISRLSERVTLAVEFVATHGFFIGWIVETMSSGRFAPGFAPGLSESSTDMANPLWH